MPFVRSRLCIAVAVLAISAVGGWAWSAGSQPEIDAQMTTPGEVPYPSLDTNDLVVGKQLSDVDVTDLDGNTIALQSFVGSPVILNFWYSTCEPCRREIPAFVQAQQANANIRFVGFNMNDSPEMAKAFGEKYGINYPIVFDQSGTVIRELGIVTAPSTLFIDSEGNIEEQYSQFGSSIIGQFEFYFEYLFAVPLNNQNTSIYLGGKVNEFYSFAFPKALFVISEFSVSPSVLVEYKINEKSQATTGMKKTNYIIFSLLPSSSSSL